MRRWIVALGVLASIFTIPRPLFADTGATKNAFALMGSGAQRNQYIFRISSDGMVLPGTAGNSFDVGSSSYPFRTGYFNNANIGNSANANSTRLDLANTAFLNFTPQVYASSSGLTIPAMSSFIQLTSTGAGLTMVASPNISTASAMAGDILIIRSSTSPIILESTSTLATSGLMLGATTRTLNFSDIIGLIFDGAGNWKELFYTTH